MLILNRSPLAQMRNEVNQLFNAMLSDLPRLSGPSQVAAPPMNVWEDNGSFYIEAELPGFSMEDVEVTVLDNEVTIMGERKPAEAEGATYLRRERNSGTFTRTWTLPAEVQADRVDAKLTNGVLTVTLPKAEKAQPRKIQVKAAS